MHPTIFHNKEHIKAFGIDLDHEYESIRNSDPKFIYCYTNGGDGLKKMIENNYELIITSTDKYNLWKKKDE